jgi:hypothetical protein
MKIYYGKSKWEMWGSTLQAFLARAKSDGFDAVEVFVPALAEPPGDVVRMVSDHGMKFIAQIVTDGADADGHIESLKWRFDLAMRCEPLFVNSHTGRDHFSFADNMRIFEAALRLAEEAGVLVTHETHRGRPLFAAHETRRYLDALPGLCLNADFSHWFCVHESDLSDQPDNIAAAIARVRYIHARIGFEEGPQVADPSAPEWAVTVAKFMDLWRRILEARRADGTEFLVVTPEFGPQPYMPCEPHTQRPLADAWTVNVQFLKTLREQLHP